MPILIVEDDDCIRSAVAAMLADEGYAVVEAANGAEALEVLTSTRPSLVLLDMQMPVMDGWGFAHELRRRGEQLPVVVMTAALNARAWADQVGADGYLAKPFDMNALLDAIAALRRPRDAS